MEYDWHSVRLDSISVINPSKRETSHLPDDLVVSFVPMTDIDATTGTLLARESKRLGEVRNGYTYFRDGDVLFAKITPCMENGKCAVAASLKNGIGFGSTEFYVIRPSKGVLPEWIHLFLRQESVRLAAKAEFKGAVGQQRVPKEYLQFMEVPLPFLDGSPDIQEQERVVSLVRTYLDRINELSEVLDRAHHSMETLRQGVLRNALLGQL